MIFSQVIEEGKQAGKEKKWKENKGEKDRKKKMKEEMGKEGRKEERTGPLTDL